MKILYISNISTDKAAGLCWSVPAGVKAQQKYDDCLWVNLNNSELDHWRAVSAFKRIRDVGDELSLDKMPSEFKNPDLVVFEGFYNMDSVRFSKILKKKNIPYIIVPRGSLSKQAFHNHNFLNYLKKKVATLLFFRSYTRSALAIQYLTQAECNDSGKAWNHSFFIVSNGIDIPEQYKTSFSDDGIKGVFIGRPSLKHKGLDMLIQACSRMQTKMRAANFTIDCHVPNKNDYDEVVRLIKENGIEDVLRQKDAVFDKQKSRALLSSDVFIMPSRFEGHPMGLIEALSYGLPVAITPGTNMLPEIEKSNAGWTTEGTTDGVVLMLKRIIEEKHQFKVKGENARQLSYQYAWDEKARQFHEMINKLLS